MAPFKNGLRFAAITAHCAPVSSIIVDLINVIQIMNTKWSVERERVTIPNGWLMPRPRNKCPAHELLWTSRVLATIMNVSLVPPLSFITLESDSSSTHWICECLKRVQKTLARTRCACEHVRTRTECGGYSEQRAAPVRKQFSSWPHDTGGDVSSDQCVTVTCPS